MHGKVKKQCPDGCATDGGRNIATEGLGKVALTVLKVDYEVMDPGMYGPPATLNNRDVIDQVARGLDKEGKLTETLVDEQLRKLTGNSPLDTKLGGNNGIDHAFVDSDGYVVIVESKQIKNGRFQLTNEKPNLPAQMSDDWMRYQVAKLEDYADASKNEAASIIREALDVGKIRKVVAGVDRINKKMIYVPIE